MLSPSNPTNLLLASLLPSELSALQLHLKPIELAQETVLFEAGQEIDRIYFPHAGIVSLVVGLASGEIIESAMIGRESLVGGSAALNGRLSLTTAVVQIAGSASVLDADRLRALAQDNNGFRTTIIRHEELILAQAQQSAACNAVHAVEARLARWLLRCRDLTGSDELPLTQEFLAQMLGVRRTSVSLVANTFQQAGFLRYRRGHIRIVDVEGLRESACECYDTIRTHAERLLGTKA
ncbi:Crp/Fnr family transcriptional regulator [Xanthobacteraceae bacterium Astr-EGSB]|uniref:Crp/Fnr family transcriptional regulator n=1 Tax=Astrobacterium formosum TaxID=3069710 RepID=UPI0027B4CD2A|nr:Crp/Fnr family transcriptional regulator [Xanthobacteraceae bacterium Astr-EGSB]